MDANSQRDGSRFLGFDDEAHQSVAQREEDSTGSSFGQQSALQLCCTGRSHLARRGFAVDFGGSVRE